MSDAELLRQFADVCRGKPDIEPLFQEMVAIALKLRQLQHELTENGGRRLSAAERLAYDETLGAFRGACTVLAQACKNTGIRMPKFSAAEIAAFIGGYLT